MADFTKKYQYTGDEYFFIITNQNECKKVASYIFKKAGDFLTSAEALNHAIHLLIKLSKDKSVKEVTEDILNGREDENINLILKVEKYNYLSVKKKEDAEKAIPIRVTKKPVYREKVKKLISFGLAIAALGTVYEASKSVIETNNNNYQVSMYIGKLGSEVDSFDYIHSRNIIDQNKRMAAENTYYLDYNNIVMDILGVANGDLDLIELCFYDAYQNLDYDKLESIDNILQTLKTYVSDKEDLEKINDVFKNYSCYLEFVLDNAVKRNLIDKNSSSYVELSNAIRSYRQEKLTEGKNPYYNLSNTDKEGINKIIRLGEKLRSELSKMYVKILESRVTEKESGKSL